jgi:hypothetical protein
MRCCQYNLHVVADIKQTWLALSLYPPLIQQYRLTVSAGFYSALMVCAAAFSLANVFWSLIVEHSSSMNFLTSMELPVMEQRHNFILLVITYLYWISHPYCTSAYGQKVLLVTEFIYTLDTSKRNVL